MNIGTIGSVRLGIGKSLRNWRLLLLYYVFNLITAITLTLPIVPVSERDFSRSVAGQRIMSGVSYAWYGEFVRVNHSLFDSILPQILFVSAVYVILEVFWGGGFYSAFTRSGRQDVGEFLTSAWRNFLPQLTVSTVDAVVLCLICLVSIRLLDFQIGPSSLGWHGNL